MMDARAARLCTACGVNEALQVISHPRLCWPCTVKPRVTPPQVRGRHPSDDCPCHFCKANDRGDNASRFTGGMDR